MISAARATLWTNHDAVPVTFKMGRKYLRCSDTVYTVPGRHRVLRVTPTFLEISTIGFSQWVNGDIQKVMPSISKKGFGVMRYNDAGDRSKLSGPWNTFDNQQKGTACAVKAGDTVRVRVAPVVHKLAPGEFSLGVRAVDVMLVGGPDAY